MNERIKGIQQKIINWWNKFTAVQRIIIISVVVGVTIALGILYWVLSQPKMVTLVTLESTKEASQITELLESEGIAYTASKDGLVIQVNEKDESAAVLLLGSNNIPTQEYDLSSVFDGNFSTTESDKSKKYQLYLEEKVASELKSIDIVDEATVTLSIPENDGTLASQKESTYASVLVSLNGEVKEGAAEGWAKYIATAVGNDNTDNVLILDSNGNVLFTGEDKSSTAGSVSNQLAVQTKYESMVKNQVKDVMLGANVYDNVEIGLNLALDFDVIEQTDHQYYVNDGNTQGYLDSESNYEQESQGGAAATPGTDANDETTYVMENNGTSTSTTTENTKDYLPNEKITNTKFATGTIKADESSITVVAATYKVYDEDKLKKSGELKGQTFAEFQAANSEKTKVDVDEELYQVVSKATGISEDNISIVAYQVPFFQASDTSKKSIWDYAPILLGVLILGFLGFIIFKSTRGEKETVLEPELSVKNLLETTQEAQDEELEDIGFNEKSEVRIMIEKFVDENPEAVAQLLRNWLNEEWD
ncbi:flagellar basal-body MS-ring/collar protein FliF [Anaerosacchariphilus polymeriproducens]|uniref:Flagellar M-ring protein FliF n=1 Tax=Anaerosacchariphilus polymeriproducens TaxID=1812858 RepID=A0A371AS92_9FIRM|nr:flagellar basal-body MS-ring/collar protein FliF [Anaerosacchariphilus polymeriproducens]RDU22437.1 flagellar M-ring protein FliF [Anaerosacchariphilus polymeriproducens]